MKEVRIKVTDEVRAAAHYAGQIVDLPPTVVYATVLEMYLRDFGVKGFVDAVVNGSGFGEIPQEAETEAG